MRGVKLELEFKEFTLLDIWDIWIDQNQTNMLIMTQKSTYICPLMSFQNIATIEGNFYDYFSAYDLGCYAQRNNVALL